MSEDIGKKRIDWDVRPIIKAIEEKASTPEGRREIAEGIAKAISESPSMQFREIDWEDRFEAVDTMPRDAGFLLRRKGE